MSASISQKVVKEVQKLLKNDYQGSDAIAHRYLTAVTLSNVIEKRKKELKEDVLAFLPLETAKVLDKCITTVERTETSSNLDLFSGSRFVVTAQVKSGQSYVDMEELRKTLNVSERRWAFAIARATKRRAPSTIVLVSERNGS